MGKLLYKILKIFLLVLLAAAVVFVVYALAHYKGWPLWTVFVILLGPTGLVLLILFLRKHYFRRREKRFVKRIVEEEPDKLALARARADREETILTIKNSFASAVGVLRRSKLTRFKNPVYALPWFVVMGETGSGKSSALRSAQLGSLLTDLNTPGPATPTRQLEWHFQENAVIIDTSGRYADAENGDGDSWREFLARLARHRRREPINGMTVAVSADMLLSRDEDGIILAARAMRRRTDELMRALGAGFPVYVLVTKMDKTPGFEGFCLRLTEQERAQAMGVVNETPPAAPGERATEILALVSERLKTLRLVLSARKGPLTPGLARFPDAAAMLEPGLSTYCCELFRQNPYLETPLFRGIFFSGARHGRGDGPAETDLLRPFAAETEAGPAKNGAFLHDFFSKTLPNDRRLHAPLPAFLTWRNVTRFAAVAGFLALFCFAAGLIALSYIKNNQALASFTGELRETPKLTHSLADDVDKLFGMRNSLLLMQRQNADWDTPRLGYDQSLAAEAKLKELFCDLFFKGVLKEFDWFLRDEVFRFDRRTSPDRIQRYTSFLISRLRLNEATQNGDFSPSLAEDVYEKLSLLRFRNRRLNTAFAGRFEDLNVSFLLWNRDMERCKREHELLIRMLQHILKINRVELGWLMDWANELPGLSPMTMEVFWGTDAVSSNPGTVSVPPAYTLEGRKMVFDYAERLDEALKTTGAAAAKNWLPAFKKGYAEKYTAAWGAFAAAFSEALHWERSRDEWKLLAARMADEDNPYFRLMHVMAVELAPYADMKNPPPWLKPIMRFERMRREALQPEQQSLQQKVDKDVTDATDFVGGLVASINGPDDAKKNGAGKDGAIPGTTIAPLSERSRKKAELAKGDSTYQKYLNALSQIRDAVQSPVASIGLVGPVFLPPQQQAKTKSPLNEAAGLARTLEGLVDAYKAPLFDELLTGPLRIFWGFGVLEAADGVQRLWRENVLAKTAHMPESKLPDALFHEKTGLVWKFVDGPAAPFLGRGPSGFYARESHGALFPFDEAFITFLDQGTRQTQATLKNYDVTVTGLPTNVNKDADEDPYLTELVLDCTEKVQKLENVNYPKTHVFKWAPQTCADTALNVKFKSVTASRRYTGAMGFAKFLRDFKYNSRKFKPADFPDAKDELAVLGVKNIAVNYKISGGVGLIALLNAEKYTVPQTIAHAWDF